MARYHLTIHFDDRLNEDAVAAALHASLVVNECDWSGFTVESSELVDDMAVDHRHGYTVDYLEWCQRDEANEVDSWV